jgi:thioredoxin-dependent peroxiredoxin
VHPGELAPDFTLCDQTGAERTLAGLLADGPVALFFYPAAMTAGCTKESCHFRDLAGEFGALGAQRVGISMDGADRQLAFASANQLDFPLLSDPGGRVAALYGVKRFAGILKVRRTTFVIAPDRRVVDVIASELRMDVHADRALAALRTLR